MSKQPTLAARPGPRCPICRKPTEQSHRPFCSRRCADIDLARWLGGGYAIAGSPESLRESEDAQGIGEGGRDPGEDEA